MNWKQTLQSKSRSQDFLWKMVLGMLATGLLIGFVVRSSLSEQLDYKQVTEKHHKIVERLENLAERGDWSEVWWRIPEAMKLGLSYKGPLVLAVVTGICWLAFCLQAIKLQGWNDPKLWLAVAAIPLGILSVWPTLFSIYWQESVWGLWESDTLVGGLRFYILGVGLREELSKLLCLLPLMPFLLRLRSELAALVISACVGLGFAVEENILYFLKESGSSVVGRYVIANPFHMTMTGLVGLAVYRGLRNPRAWGPLVLATFGLIVFAHGLYDAFGAVPALVEYSLVGLIIFALVVYQFFHELRELRPRGGDTVSLTANFLCGVSLVVVSMFIYLSAAYDWNRALTAMGSDALGAAVMVYLFLREMPETMVSV